MNEDDGGPSNCPAPDHGRISQIGDAGAANPSRSTEPDKATPSITARIDNLRRVTGQFLTGETLDRDLAKWLGSALQCYLNRSARTLEEALGLIFPKGGIPWWREEAIRKRDAALRELAERILPGLSPCSQAQKIRTLAVRYAASAWRFDCGRDRMPIHYVGSAKEWLWRAFTSGATMPLCERQLRHILAK